MKNKDQPAFPDYMAENHLNGEGLATALASVSMADALLAELEKGGAG